MGGEKSGDGNESIERCAILSVVEHRAAAYYVRGNLSVSLNKREINNRTRG